MGSFAAHVDSVNFALPHVVGVTGDERLGPHLLREALEVDLVDGLRQPIGVVDTLILRGRQEFLLTLDQHFEHVVRIKLTQKLCGIGSQKVPNK